MIIVFSIPLQLRTYYFRIKKSELFSFFFHSAKCLHEKKTLVPSQQSHELRVTSGSKPLRQNVR